MAFYYSRSCIRKLPGGIIREIPIPEPEIIEGFGARGKIGDFCKQAGVRSVLLVTDTTLYGLGYHEKIVSSLKAERIACAVFSDISSEPTVDIIRAGRKAAVDCGADCIAALGGGSVLDSCKIIAAAAKKPDHPIQQYLLKFVIVRGKTLPMISVPSTAGTGAEHTVGAVVKSTRGVKKSTVVAGLDVRLVVLDSELTVNAPQSVTVWCGIDALSHGLEGYLSDTDSSAEDMRKSAECVRLVMENIPVLLSDPKNIEARQKMSLAAFYGGNAINKQLAGYIHAFAHSIGGLCHIPHGKAIAYCTIPILESLKDISRDRLSELSVHCGIAEEGDAPEKACGMFIEAVRKLLSECGLEKGCTEVRTEDYPKLIRMINMDSVNYSPPKLYRNREVRELLEHIRTGD